MKTVPLSEAKAKLGSLLDEVEGRDEEIRRLLSEILQRVDRIGQLLGED